MESINISNRNQYSFNTVSLEPVLNLVFEYTIGDVLCSENRTDVISAEDVHECVFQGVVLESLRICFVWKFYVG